MGHMFFHNDNMQLNKQGCKQREFVPQKINTVEPHSLHSNSELQLKNTVSKKIIFASSPAMVTYRVKVPNGHVVIS